MRFLKALSLIIVYLVVFAGFTTIVKADDQSAPSINYPSTVIKIDEEKDIDVQGHTQKYQKLELRIDGGDKQGQVVIVENGTAPMVNEIIYKTGNRVLVMSQKDPDGRDVYFITDFIRTSNLYWLAGVFVLITILVGRGAGVKSLLGMVFSFFIIFKFILPRLLAGADPVWTVAIASVFVIPPTFYLAHGFNKKTTVAILGTFISLMITIMLASYFVSASRLTGYASEEAGFLQAAKGGTVNVKGLLLAGILIGAFGILNDITISQASVVEQLKNATGKIDPWTLYKNAMKVGQDHIASMVNTLVLVYAGSSLPLLLLFVNNPHPVSEVINYEIVAEEIVKTFLSSSALILAVPLTTIIAALAFTKESKKGD